MVELGFSDTGYLNSILYFPYIGEPSFSLKELFGYPLREISSRPSNE